MRPFRIIPTLWLILWILAIPLIHVHPDAEHHGLAGHDHGGVLHTVFSQDLDGEYGHQTHTHAVPETQPPALPFLSAAADLLSHPEIGFSFLSSIPDRPSAKQALADVTPDALALTLLTCPSCLTHQNISPAPILALLANDLSSRAPPATSI